MTDESSDDAPARNAVEYRVKARHPRRDSPLVITDADGQVIGTSGQTCDGCSQAELDSMIRNGYVERIDDAATPTAPAPVPARPRRRAAEREA